MVPKTKKSDEEGKKEIQMTFSQSNIVKDIKEDKSMVEKSKDMKLKEDKSLNYSPNNPKTINPKTTNASNAERKAIAGKTGTPEEELVNLGKSVVADIHAGVNPKIELSPSKCSKIP